MGGGGGGGGGGGPTSGAPASFALTVLPLLLASGDPDEDEDEDDEEEDDEEDDDLLGLSGDGSQDASTPGSVGSTSEGTSAIPLCAHPHARRSESDTTAPQGTRASWRRERLMQ